MAELPELDRAAVESALFAGQKIEAIKLYRTAVPGTGLAEAKAAVEAMETKLRQQRPERFTKAAGKSGCLGMILMALVFAGAGLVVWMVQR